MDSQIEKIRAELSIQAAWRILGLAGNPAKECKSPFREEKRPSFSIYSKEGWQRWFDHGTGQGGDVVDLWASAKGISVKEAINEILSERSHLNSSVKAPSRPPEAFLSKSAIRWPPGMREPTEDECRALGTLRGLSPSAFHLAGRLGTLKVATVYGAPAWILSDNSGILAEARRFDGQMYEKAGGQKLKSFALPGSKKFWPVGLQTTRPEYNGLSNIVLVEGAPDYFAALALAIETEINFRPAAMLGASTNIGPEAEQYMRGAHVLILPHNDLGGEKSAERWALQARALGARKIVVQPLPFEHNDLNDFLVSSPNDASQLLKGFKSEWTNPGS